MIALKTIALLVLILVSVKIAALVVRDILENKRLGESFDRAREER